MSNIGSIDRSVAILDLYSQGEYELSPTDVAKKLDISTSTAFRTMAALYKVGLLVMSSSKGKYCLGPKILNYSRAYMASLKLNNVALPHIKKLNEVTKETVGLDIIDDDNNRICVATVDSKNTIRRVLVVGEKAPIHAGAPSKILLAFMPEEKAKEILKSKKLIKKTDQTKTKISEIMQDVEFARKNGYSFSKGENDEHAYAISAPVKKHTGETIAVLSIAGITILLTQELQDKYIQLVQQTASAISHDLGYWSEP